MDHKKIKEKLAMIHSYMNKISVTGTANAENLTIAAKLLQDLYQSIPDEKGDAEKW